jgi:hypothetical protein
MQPRLARGQKPADPAGRWTVLAVSIKHEYASTTPARRRVRRGRTSPNDRIV